MSLHDNNSPHPPTYLPLRQIRLLNVQESGLTWGTDAAALGSPVTVLLAASQLGQHIAVLRANPINSPVARSLARLCTQVVCFRPMLLAAAKKTTTRAVPTFCRGLHLYAAAPTVVDMARLWTHSLPKRGWLNSPMQDLP